MPRRKFRYQMIQPEHINSIKVGNHYEVICEESYWDLEVGPVEWHEVDTPLEIPIDEIDSFIVELNQTSVNNIVEDFIEVSRELLPARMLSRDAERLLKNRRQWIYERWKEFKMLFDFQGWEFESYLPDIFKFLPNDDYTVIRFDSEIINITRTQGIVIKVLHKKYLDGIYYATTDEIFDAFTNLGIDIEATKISQIFDKKRRERDILIKNVGQGKYSLNLPSYI